MAQAQRRYAPCRRTAVAAWLTALISPALLGWAFWAATAAAPADRSGTVPHLPLPSQQVTASTQPTAADPIGPRHR